MVSTDNKALIEVLSKISRLSRWTDSELITKNARKLTRMIAKETPRLTGKGRAGWWPAWTALGIAGRPYTNKSLGEETIKRGKGRPKEYVSQGSVVDERTKPLTGSFTLRNSTYVKSGGQRYNYLYMSTQKGQNQGWLDMAILRTKWEWEQLHERLLDKASKGTL